MTTQTRPIWSARVGDPRRAVGLIAATEALKTGHFRLLADLHSDVFLRFSRIASDRNSLNVVTRWLAPSVAGWSPSALLAPSTAGVGLASSIARELEIPLYLAELDDSGRACGVIGDPRLRGERIALVNDVVTTGQGLERLMKVTEELGGHVVGAAWFASRRPVALEHILHVPTCRVVDLDLPTWSPEACRLCASELPVEDALDLN